MIENNNINNIETSTTKQPKMLIGSDSFKDLVLHSDVFVDKSLLNKGVLEDTGKVILIVRPRRWGKSLNMDMLKKFLEIEVDAEGNSLPPEQQINSRLFTGGEVDLGLPSGRKKILSKLKIAEYPNIIREYQGKFPVIHVSFKGVMSDRFDVIYDRINGIIADLFKRYSYLLHSYKLSQDNKEDFVRYSRGDITEAELSTSILFLSRMLYQHFDRNCYILIDEYDGPINYAYAEFGTGAPELKKVILIIRSIFEECLKTNPYLEKGIITGILRVAKAELFSGLNNVTEYSLLDERFSELYGFTQEEVDHLLKMVPAVTDHKKIKDWYNGYTFGNQIIYNPWSIMQCLGHRGKVDYYWLDSGGTGLIDKVLLSDKIQEDLQSLLEGKGIIKKLYKQISFLEIEDNTDIFFSLLVFAGYLNPELANDDDEDPMYKLTIPNKEVRGIYVERVIRWVGNKLSITGSDYRSFVSLLANEKIEQFAEQFREYLLNSTSYHDLSIERDYHNLLGGILAPLAREYIIESNRESGLGRFDHILIPKAEDKGKSAIILEYKVAKNKEDLKSKAEEALLQIIDNKYHAKVKEYPYVKSVINIGVAFCSKEFALLHKITDI